MTKNLKHALCNQEGDSIESRLAETDYLVEATSNEWFSLWDRWCEKSRHHWEPVFKEWEQLGGWLTSIGEINDRPIAIELNWTKLDGFLVCNWEATSQLVDYVMINKWITENYGRTHYNNSHSLITKFKEWKESK